MLYVFIDPVCEKNAAAIGMSTEVERLKEKLIREQSTAGLRRHPKPFLKKAFGRTRLILTELIDGEDIVLCFLRHVYKHEIGDDYESYFSSIRVPRNDDPEIVSFLIHARAAPLVAKPEMSALEMEYLHVARGRNTNVMVVMESPLWVRAMAAIRETPGKQGLLTPIWEALQGLCEQDAVTRGQTTAARQEKYGMTVIYRYYPESNKIFLVAPLEDGGGETLSRDASAMLSEASSFDETGLLRHSARAYPDYVPYDREIWETMQSSVEANLALSPEESNVMDYVLDPAEEGGFPLFINGRPGSGKSTILQYLFATFLHAHLARPTDMRLPVPPLYLTYNERLLQNAKTMVEDIFKCNAEKLVTAERVDLSSTSEREEFDKAFAYFREFLLSLSPTKGRFERRLYVDFHRFKARYSTELQRGDAKLRKLSPEVAWHTLRTYIKGKSDSAGKDGTDEYFDPASYAELPRDEITISSEIYELVWDKVWNGWYRSLCEVDGHWDDQDLARHILSAELATSSYPAIFCDESQDFTTIELELIFRLSLYSQRRVDPHYLSRIPFAFAGDPFQTLNPTGFRWDAIKANFHTNIVQQLDPVRRSRVDFTFKELAYNYRSTTNIVRFCNLIQLKRGELFDIQDLTPQSAWSVDEGGLPTYFRDDDLSCQQVLKDQTELVIVVPCQEGEEKAFVQKDDFLKGIALDKKGEIVRNVLSPMRAKGLEFARVVLYKFGNEAVEQEFAKLMDRMENAKTKELHRGQTLGLEYFFNSVYVGASRAQRRLFVVDTQKGLSQFWRFATDAATVDSLRTPRRQRKWESTDVHHMLLGSNDSWALDRDDPRALAERFFQQGQQENSAYLLQLARTQFRTLGDEAKQERCAALIADFEGRHSDAAASYVRLNELDEGIRCYWEAGTHRNVIEVAGRDQGRFLTNPYVIASKFLAEPQDANSASDFLKGLARANTMGRKEFFAQPRWADAIEIAVQTLGKSILEDAVNPSASLGDGYKAIEYLRNEHGLVVEGSRSLAALAYHSGNHRNTVDIWDKLEKRPRLSEPRFVVRARATISPYPDNLRWYGVLNDDKAVIEEYKQKGDAGLENSARATVLKSALALSEYDLAVDVASRTGQPDSIRRCLSKLLDDDAGAKNARRLLPTYLTSSIESGRFRQLVDDLVKPAETGLIALEALLKQDAMRLRAYGTLFRGLARSVKLVDEKGDGRYVSGNLERLVQRDAGQLLEFASVEEIGAALERAGRVEGAIKFYESAYKNQEWGRERAVHDFARQRWMKCSERYVSEDPKKRGKLSQQLVDQSKQWGLEIPKDEFPVLKPLTSADFTEILNPEIFPDEVRHVAKVANPLAVAETGNEDSRSSEAPDPQPVPLEAKRASVSKVDLQFALNAMEFDVCFLPGKRRVEVRHRKEQDLLQVHVDISEVESRDVEIVKHSTNQWWISSWGMRIALLRPSGAGTMVDFCSDDDRRIICLLV